MNKKELESKVKEIFSDEEYVKSLFELEEPADVQASLKQKGVELTIDDIISIKNLMERAEDGELDDEALEAVSGGSVAAGIIYGILAGACYIGTTVVGVVHHRTGRW